MMMLRCKSVKTELHKKLKEYGWIVDEKFVSCKMSGVHCQFDGVKRQNVTFKTKQNQLLTIDETLSDKQSFL